MTNLPVFGDFFKKNALAAVLFAGNFLAFAQDAANSVTKDGATTTTTTTTTEEWYANPIYLAIGALLLIILIALLARGKKRG